MHLNQLLKFIVPLVMVICLVPLHAGAAVTASINGGAAITSVQNVTITLNTGGNTGAITVSEGAISQTFPTGTTTIPWTLSANEGTKSIRIQRQYFWTCCGGGMGYEHANASIVLDTAAQPPVTTPAQAAGTYSLKQGVMLNGDGTQASIYYTTDNTTPTNLSTLYTAPVLVDVDKTLKFFGIDTFGTQEAVQTANYLIRPQTEWSVQHGVAATTTQGFKTATDSAGNVYVTGMVLGGLDGNVSSGGWDGYLIKYSSTGAKLWTRQLGTTAADQAFSVATDLAGNVYITGVTGGGLDGNVSAGSFDAFLIQYDSSGTKIWTRQWGTATQDYARDVATDATGNIYVASNTSGGLDGNVSAGGNDAFLTQFDSAGNKIWTQQLGSVSDDIPLTIITDSTGKVYIAGYTSGGLDGNVSAGGNDAFLTQYDSAGTKIWTRQWGTTTHDYPNAVTADAAGNIYVVGYTVGGLDGNVSAGGYDAFLTQYDSAGTKIWTRQWGTAAHDYPRDVVADATGNIYVTGYTSGGLDGNANAGSADVFLTRFDTAGVKAWSRLLGGGASDTAEGIAISAAGDIYITGNTTSELDGNAKVGNSDMFLLSMDTVAPVISAPASVTIEATGVTTAVTDIDASVSVTDNVATGLVAAATPSGPFNIGSHSVVWNVSDYMDNTATPANQTITIIDTTPPSVTAPANVGPIEATGVFTTAALGTASATDIVDGALTPTVNDSGPFPVGVTAVTWSVTDSYGNTGSATQSVTIQDTTAPAITLIGLADIYVETGSTYVDQGASSSDAVDGPAAVTAAGTVNTAAVAIYTLTYDRTDSAGNAANQVVRRVHVQDTTAPIITGTPLADATAEATGANTSVTLTPPGATDLFNVNVTNNAPANFPVGTTVVTWSATDANGLFSTANQNVIISDTTAPTITLLGSDPYTLLAGQTYNDAGATASDLVDGNITGSITTVNPVAGPAVEGVYTVTYNVSDSYANAATEMSRTVRVAAAASTGNGTTVQLPLTGRAATVDIYSAGQVVFGLTSSAAGGTLPANTTFPFGVIDYYTSVANAGDSQTVRLSFSSALPANLVVYKEDGAGNYTLLSNAIWTKIDANTIEVALTDGDAATDLDGLANGVIHDPIAIGGATTPAAATGGGGGGGCTINPEAEFDPTMLLLLLAAVALIGRNRTDI